MTLSLKGIHIPIDLNPQALHCWTLGTVEHPGMNGTGIGQPSHKSPQGFYFSYQLTLPWSSHCWIAGHQSQALGVAGNQGDPGAQPGCSPGCFDTCMATPNHHHIKRQHSLSL